MLETCDLCKKEAETYFFLAIPEKQTKIKICKACYIKQYSDLVNFIKNNSLGLNLLLNKDKKKILQGFLIKFLP